MSYNSKLYHEKKVAELIKKFVNLIPVRHQWAQIRKLGVKTFSREYELHKNLIEGKSEDSRQTLPSKNEKNNRKDLLNKEETLIDRPKIYVFLFKDQAKVTNF